MAIAAAFLAATLTELGHDVRRLAAPVDWAADIVITTISPTWRRLHAAAVEAGALERVVYWHHANGVPEPCGHTLAAPPSIPMHEGWPRHVVLPPSSWAVEDGGERTGRDVVVAGCGPAKGGHVALEVARLCPELSWYALRGRSSMVDQAPWRSLPNAEVADGIVAPEFFLARARVVLSPTRFDVHPLLLVEAAVRGIPVVCTDLPGTRAAAGPHAFYLPMTAPVEAWAEVVRCAMSSEPPKLELPPYRDVVARALEHMVGDRRAAA